MVLWSQIPIFIATTNKTDDDPVVDISKSLGIPYFRGDEHHVLERFYRCAKKCKLEIVIRVTSDCPLIDGNLIAEGLDKYEKLANDNVYYSNSLQRSYPRGLDFEIFSFAQLEGAYKNATEEAEKEHVTPYINQNKSGKTILVNHIDSQDNSDLRWTLDTESDWELLKTLFEVYNVANLPYQEIVKIIRTHPELEKINTHVKQKEIKL